MCKIPFCLLIYVVSVNSKCRSNYSCLQHRKDAVLKQHLFNHLNVKQNAVKNKQYAQ